MPTDEWFPVVALVLGSVLTMVGGIVSAAFTHQWEIRKVREEREAAEKSRRLAFQHDNLLKLQDAGIELLEASSQWLDEKREAFWRTGEWKNDATWEAQVIQHDTRQKPRMARVRAQAFACCVMDDALRQLLHEAIEFSGKIQDAKSNEEAWQSLSDMRHKYVAIDDSLGTFIRKSL
jgi:hypothetical protein